MPIFACSLGRSQYNLFNQMCRSMKKKITDQNKVESKIYFHGNQISHYKHRAFFKTLFIFISANNEDICLKLLPSRYTHGHTLTSYKNNDLDR